MPDFAARLDRVMSGISGFCRSKILRPGQKETLQLKISDVQKLELRATGGEGHNHNSWAIWADPLLEK